MSKFKVGDTVCCVETISKQDGGPRAGEIFEVLSVSSNTGSIGIDLSSGLKNNEYITYSKNVCTRQKPNGGASCFELVKQHTTKHYKWDVAVQYQTPDGTITIIETKTEHYVSPEKIKDYIKFLAAKESGKLMNYHYKKIDNEYVEDIEC